MSSQIVSYLKDGSGRKYKIEKYPGLKTIISRTTNFYRILFDNGDVYAKDFESYNDAVRYLERRIGNVREY